jgi:hypothetical protein
MANWVALELKLLLSGLRYCLAFASFTSQVTISKTIFSDSRLQSWSLVVSFYCCIFLDGFLTFSIWFDSHGPKYELLLDPKLWGCNPCVVGHVSLSYSNRAPGCDRLYQHTLSWHIWWHY